MINDLILPALQNLNNLLTAGIAITAFSLLLYALSFNLRNPVMRAFTVVMSCIVIVFVSETMSSYAESPTHVEFWLRFQWTGLVFLPAGYLHLSDSILATTGRPSRGRRRRAVRIVYAVALLFLLTLPFSLLVGPLDGNLEPVPHLQPTWVTTVYAVFYCVVMVIAWINLWRALNRTKARASHRRMIYLLAGSLAPAVGSFPFLVFANSFATEHQLIFWLTLNVILGSIIFTAVMYGARILIFDVPFLEASDLKFVQVILVVGCLAATRIRTYLRKKRTKGHGSR